MMQNLMIMLVLSFARAQAPGKAGFAWRGGLAVRFENLKSQSGTIRLALYRSSDDFMREDRAALYNFPVEKSGGPEITLPELSFGTYALAVFIDENDNNRLDKNLLGIPTEPYGFSGEAISRWRVPHFDEAKFRVGPVPASVSVKLISW